MAVWHTADREDNQYLCLHVGGFQQLRGSDVGLPLLFFCWISVCWSSSLPQKQHKVQEVMCSYRGGLYPLTVACCRAPSQKPRLLLSDLCLSRLMSHFLHRGTWRATKTRGILQITVLASLQGSAVSGARAPIEK